MSKDNLLKLKTVALTHELLIVRRMACFHMRLPGNAFSNVVNYIVSDYIYSVVSFELVWATNNSLWLE